MNISFKIGDMTAQRFVVLAWTSKVPKFLHFSIWTLLVQCLGNHCGWPPVPVNGDVTTVLVPGDTTKVTYKCADPFVLDPKELETSTCDQLTGQWTQPPKCICPHPQVVNGKIIRRTDYSADFQCRDGYHLIGNGTATCTETGTWTNLPSCNNLI